MFSLFIWRLLPSDVQNVSLRWPGRSESFFFNVLLLNSDWTEVKVPPWISHSCKHKFTVSFLTIKSVKRSFWCPGATSAIFITCLQQCVSNNSLKLRFAVSSMVQSSRLYIGYRLNVLSVTTSNYFRPLMFYLCLQLSINIQTISGTQSITGRDLTVTAVTQWVEVFSEHRKRVFIVHFSFAVRAEGHPGSPGGWVLLGVRAGEHFFWQEK